MEVMLQLQSLDSTMHVEATNATVSNRYQVKMGARRSSLHQMATSSIQAPRLRQWLTGFRPHAMNKPERALALHLNSQLQKEALEVAA